MKRKGMSLMEIMITLVIVAIIAGMAYPSYQKMIARSKQTEAKTILQAIYMAQELYMTSNQVYSDNLDLLDMTIPSNTRYSYSLSTGEDGKTFMAKATANIDSDEIVDTWEIDQTNTLTNRVNDAIE